MDNTSSHIGIITQARMTSTRLPGKILKEINNISLLQYHTERLKQTGLDICIATTSNSTDDCVNDYAHKHALKIYRGDENNVLSRFYEAATKFKYDIIVRVTSDCPLIDPHLIRNSIEKYLKLSNPNLYMSNVIERTFSRGFDFEIFSYEQLEDAYQKATDASDLEHVTPFIWKNKTGNTEFYHVKQEEDNSAFRLTVDTPEDLELIKELISKYDAHKKSYNEIENILNANPKLIDINSHVEQKKLK